jgi:superfamily II DNA helicase RecQ
VVDVSGTSSDDGDDEDAFSDEDSCESREGMQAALRESKIDECRTRVASQLAAGRAPCTGAILTDAFGIKQFRPNQERLVKASLAGKSVFYSAQTGAGKSLV